MFTEDMIKQNCPNLFKLIELHPSRWKKFDQALAKRKSSLKLSNIYGIIKGAQLAHPQPKAILEYVESLASDLKNNLSEEIIKKLRKNSSQIFDPSVNGKQIFYERLAELRLIQKFAGQDKVEINGIDVKIEETEKDIDLVITSDSTQFNLEFISIRLEPDKIESKEGVEKILLKRINDKIESKFSEHIPKKGETMIIPVIFTDIKKLVPFGEIFNISHNKPFGGVVPFFYMAFSGISKKSGRYIWGIDEAYSILKKMLN